MEVKAVAERQQKHMALGHYVAYRGKLYISSEALLSRLKSSKIDATKRTLNYYRAEGLIPMHRRFKKSKKRFYPIDAYDEIRGIKLLNQLLGWSLKDILAIKRQRKKGIKEIISDLNGRYQEMLPAEERSPKIGYFDPRFFDRMTVFSAVVKSVYKGGKRWEGKMPRFPRVETLHNKEIQQALKDSKETDEPILVCI